MNLLANNGWGEFAEQLITSIKDFFSPELSNYINFNLGSDSMINIHIIVIGVFIGVMLAAGYTIFVKQILGKFTRKLLDEDITAPDKAKTLAELGMDKNIFIKLGLRGYTLGRVVSSIEKDEFFAAANEAQRSYEENRTQAKKEGKRIPPFKYPEFRKKTTECRYYIAEKNRYTAEMRFNPNGSGYGTFFFVLLIAIICVIMVYAFLPQILRLADTVLSNFTVKGNTHLPTGAD